MYVPAWPTLGPAHFLRPATASAYPISARSKAFFYLARNAIYHLFRRIGRENPGPVLVPDYHSGNEVWAIRAAGLPVEFYRIDRRMEPDLRQVEWLLSRGASAMYTIHYLGWPQPIERIAALCRHYGIPLVEDCALSLFSSAGGRPLGSFGAYSIFCLYKTVPVPNGGVLVDNFNFRDWSRLDGLRPPGGISVAGRSAELVLEWVRSRSDPAGRLLTGLKRVGGRMLSRMKVNRTPVGDIGFNLDDTNLEMSPISHRLLARIDADRVRERRRENYRLLTRLAAGRIRPLHVELPPGVCPLFLPVLVSHKRRAAEALWSRRIEAVQFWNHGDERALGDEEQDARFLRRHVLELPIHQGVSRRQIEYMAEQMDTLEFDRFALDPGPSSLVPRGAAVRHSEKRAIARPGLVAGPPN